MSTSINPENLRLFFAFSGLFIFFLNTGSGIMVLRANPGRITNRYYSLMCFAVSFWAFFHFLWLFKFHDSPQGALIATKLLSFGSLWIPVLAFSWIVYLLNEQDIFYVKVVKYIGWTLTFAFVPLFFTSYFVSHTVEILPHIYWPQAGPLYFIYLAIYLLYPGYATVKLILNISNPSVETVKKKQYMIIVAASFLGFIGGATNFPQWYGFSMWPWGHPLVAVYFFLFTYAMIKYRFLEIETVIHKTFLYGIVSSLIFIPIGLFMYVARPYLSKMTWYQLGLLFTVMFFLFKAYYTKIQPYIDHLFRRRKYDYQFLLKEIPTHIAGILDIDALSNNLFDILKETIYPRNIVLMVKDPQEARYIVESRAGYGDDVSLSGPGYFYIDQDNPIVDYCLRNREVLEKDVVKVDPKYSAVKEAFLKVFDELELQLLLPFRIEQEEKLVGFLGLGRRETLRMYTIKDTELLLDISTQIAVSVDNALYHKDILEKQSLLQQITLAKELQSSLLPPNPASSLRGITIYGSLLPAKEVGGDYYDFIYQKQNIDSNENAKISIAVGDVSGKGVDAGIVMAMTKTTIFTLALEEGVSPREILRRTNRILYHEVNMRKFVSLLFFDIVPYHNRIVYSAAGHEHILIYRKSSGPDTDAEVEVIKSGGVILGMVEDVERFLEEKTLDLNSGDKVLLYTDGVTEARNPQEEFFGLNRLVESFRRHGHLPIKETIHNIHGDVNNFISTREQYDDITLVGIHKD